ncbi:ATP-binding protein [Aeromicrobium sp. SMF47]|uniref:uridine kinase family protein n=1 Tax=Aeromicrobium TaxID=2040 RepID=UPI0013C0B51F|nr:MULTISPECIES: ATP-binding protein [Aeromicrobium]MRJ75030.1 ATP-binding protein [Aeromicrobium yanjiei]MRK02914.1 ATP-binding protein [Aeromicrobium sp. S22]
MAASSGVVIVAGPSGSGKSHLAARLGWPVLRLDDFYRDADAPHMPRSTLGIVDWDHPDSWDAVTAVGTIAELCASGTAEVPVYDIAASRRTGTQTLHVPDGQFIAEGLFAPIIVDACREAGLLRAAICLRRPASVTFALRLSRDLREGRKSPSVLVRRGWRLLQDEPRIVAEAVAHGCDPMTPRNARRLLAG